MKNSVRHTKAVIGLKGNIMAKLLFVAGSLALLPATIAFDLTEPSFDRWRARYGIPEYNSREARARALRTWRDNLRRVEQHNSNPSKTYRMVRYIPYSVLFPK